jgi:hypothetical protein
LLSCWFLSWLFLQPWRWRRHVSPKCQFTFNGLHGVCITLQHMRFSYHYTNSQNIKSRWWRILSVAFLVTFMALAPSTFTQAGKFLICIGRCLVRISASTQTMLRFFMVSSAPPSKCQDSTSNYAIATSFEICSLFTTILPFDIT